MAVTLLQHPLGGTALDSVLAKIDLALDEIVARLTTPLDVAAANSAGDATRSEWIEMDVSDEWGSLQSEFVAKGTTEALQLLMDRGMVERQPAEPLAYLIQAALNDSALTIAHAPNPTQASEEAMAAFDFLLHGIGKAPEAKG